MDVKDCLPCPRWVITQVGVGTVDSLKGADDDPICVDDGGSRFLDAGIHVPLSSDFPGETLNPFWGMYSAETRQNPEGQPDGGWFPGQRLTREEVLNAYTFEAAYAGFEEEIKGKIAPGMLADFIILSDDILTIEPKKLLSLSVDKTYVGGVLVYRKY